MIKTIQTGQNRFQKPIHTIDIILIEQKIIPELIHVIDNHSNEANNVILT